MTLVTLMTNSIPASQSCLVNRSPWSVLFCPWCIDQRASCSSARIAPCSCCSSAQLEVLHKLYAVLIESLTEPWKALARCGLVLHCQISRYFSGILACEIQRLTILRKPECRMIKHLPVCADFRCQAFRHLHPALELYRAVLAGIIWHRAKPLLSHLSLLCVLASFD